MAELMCRGGHIGVFFFRFRCHVSVRKNNPGVRETAGTGVEEFVSRPVKSINAVDITGRLAVVVDVYGVMFKCLQMWNHVTCLFLSKR